MPVDLRQISFYPRQRQYIFSDSEPGIEIVQSGSGDFIKCTDASNAMVFRITAAGLIQSSAGQAEYSTLASTTGNPITLIAQGTNQDVRFMHTTNNTANVMGFFDGATKHFQLGGVHNATPDSRLHVIAATAGSVTAETDTIITAENDDNAFISLLAPTSSGILFGDVADADIGRITYTHSNNALNLFVSASQQFTYTDALLTFNKATNLRTSSGSLTLQPVSGAHLNFTLGGIGDFRVNTNQLYVDTSAARVGVNTATPSASLEVVATESATVPALMVQNSFDAVSNQVAVFKGSNRGTAADNDNSYISYMMEDDSGSSVEIGRQIWQINDVTANTKDSKFTWQVMVNNTLTDMLEISSSAAAVPTATFSSGDAIFNDNVSIRLGTAGVEADLSSNGTDVKWEFAATADLLIGRASSPAPDGLVHIWASSAGTVDTLPDSLLTLEKSDNAYITFLAPTVSGINFGDAADNNVGSITYTHASNTLNTTINAVSQLNHTDGAFAFQKTTEISSTGTLRLAAWTATGNINLANYNMINVDINSGNIAGITFNGTTTATADMTFRDNVKVTLGTGGDVDVYYDSADMVINTRVVGTGDLITHSQLVWGTGVAVTAADYSVGRDADGTNQMHLNVPTGAGWEYSINNTAKLTYATGAFNFTEATTISTSTGQLSLRGAGGVVVNEAGNDEDFRIESNSNANTLVIDANTFGGIGSLAIGNAVVNTAYLRIAPTAITSTANQPYATVRIAPVGVTVPTGTSAVVSSLHVVEPVISATGTVTTAATVYIANAPTEGGSANHALMVAAGTTSLAGGGSLTGTWSDLGTVTTIDINGGSIDGVTIGTNAVVTDLRVDQLQINDGTISTLASNNPIILAPHGTGDVQLDADQIRIGDANANATLTTNGTGDLILNTNAGTNSGSITIADAANGNISLVPNGSGNVVITADELDVSGEAMSISIIDNSATSLTIDEGNNTYLTFNTANSGGSKIVPGVKIEAGAVEIEGSAFDINGGTVDAITTLTLAANVDVGNYTIRANNFLADSHTATRLFFAGTNGVLTSDSDLTFATDTLTATKIGAFESAGAINFASQAMTNVNIDSGAIDGTTIGANATSTIVGTTIDATTDFTIGSLVIIDDQIQMTPSTADTVTIAAAANGVLNITTVDDNANGANFNATIDGNIILDAAASLTLSADGGNITMDDGTLTIFDFNVDDTTLTIHDDQDTGDKAVITMAQHGALSIVTTDDDAAAANITITADGTFEADGSTITLDSSGDVILDASGGDVFFKAGGTTFGSATNTSGNLIIKSGTTTAATFAGANVTLAGTVGSGAITSTGLITGVGVTSTGDFTTTGYAADWDLIDNNANALSFDAAGKAGILNIDTQNGSERVTMSGNLLVSGDFEVAGSNTTISTTVIVADPLVALATTNTGNAVDIGFFGRYRTNGTNLYTGFVWNADASKYILFHGNQAAPTTTVNTSGTGYAASTLVLGTLETTNVTATNIAAHNLTGKLTAGSTEIEGSNFDINGGTVDAITTLTVANNVDVGGYTVRASNFLADSHTATRVFFAGTNGALTSDSDLTFATDTLTATKIGAFEAAGAINFANQNMTLVDINSGDMTGVTISGALTWSAAQDLNSQALTNVNIDSGAIDGVTLGTNSVITNAVIDDVGINGKVITMTGSSGDTAVFTAAANGAFSLVTTDAAGTDASIQIIADGTVDIDSAVGDVITLDSGGAINLEPYDGSVILLDGTISIDAGVVTGVTSITSTAFVGTLSTAAQTNITSLGAQAANLNMNSNTIYGVSQLSGSHTDGPRVAGNEASSATNPVFIVDRQTMTTGVGGTGDYVSLIEGGVEVLRADGGKVGIGGSGNAIDTVLHVESADPILKLQDSSSDGNAAIAYVSFRSADNTEIGFVGDGSGGDDDIYLQAATGDLKLLANGTVSLENNSLSNIGAAGSDWDSTSLRNAGDYFGANGKGMVIGHPAQITGTGLAKFQVLGSGSIDSHMILGRFSADAGNASIEFVKSRDPAIADGTFAIVEDDDILGNLMFLPDDGVDFATQAAIFHVEVDDASPEAGGVGTAFVWKQMPGGGTTAAQETMRINALGQVLIGDNTIGTSVDMDTAGLVINQAAGDKQILAFKSSDVGHGITTEAETDTYFQARKASTTQGGGWLMGLTEGASYGLLFEGLTTGVVTTKSASGAGSIVLRANIRNGTGKTTPSANANLVVMQSAGNTRFIFDAEGDFYSDASINADYYDDYNDPVLVRDLDLAITQRFDQWTKYNRDDIEKAKLAHFDEDGKPFVNWTKVWKLHNGAIWQLNEKIEMLIEENKILKESISKMLPEG